MLPEPGDRVNRPRAAAPHRVGLKASRKRSRNALILHSGAVEVGSTPLCQCHAEIARNTDGSLEMMLIGT